jgi:hypothetical protein
VTEAILGVIQLKKARNVHWVRVSTREGWASTLCRVLGKPEAAGSSVSLQSWQDGGLRDVLSFDVPDGEDERGGEERAG